MSSCRCIPIALLVVLVFPVIALAQAQPATSALPDDISLTDLKEHLRPMDAKELEAEAEAWKGKLKANAVAIRDAKLARQPAEVTALKAAQDEIVARFDVILGEFEAQAGDVAAYRAYRNSVAGLDLTDKAALKDLVLEWVTSPERGVKWGKNIAFFVVILIAFRILAGLVAGILRKGLGASRLKISDLLRDFFVGTTRNVIFFVGLIVALPFIGVEIGPFLAAMGVAGFVIGFALQETLGNFAAGIMILLYRPYDIGNVINAAGVMGKVASMSLVSTTLKTPDNQDVIVPNGAIWGGVITNITANDTRRVDLVFGIGYEDDIAKAEKVLEELVKDHPKVLQDPAPAIKVSALADSSVNLLCRPWARTSDYWDVYWDLTRSVKERFDEEGISIPYPQRDVHMHQVSV